jgi:integrase/recombinase XerD
VTLASVSTVLTSVYAASFEPSPGLLGWLLVARTEDGLSRVDVVSDWLATALPSTPSPNTLKSQAESLALWWRWCTDVGVNPLRADAVQFARFVLALQTVPKEYPLTSPVRAFPGDSRLRSDGTIRLRVIHIKAFYRWAETDPRVSVATSRAITAFKTPPAATNMTANRLTAAQSETLREVALHPRNRYAVELLHEAGLREGEAAGLRIDDMCLNEDLANLFECRVEGGSHLHVRRRMNTNGALAKTRYERVVPITARLMTAYRDLQAWNYDHAPTNAESPFVLLSLTGSTKGGPLTLSGFRSMWEDHINTVPGLEQVWPHLLRHTFASELIDAGVDRFTVQELLGHRSPRSTAVYTHAHMDTLIKAVDRLADWRNDRLGRVG